MLANLGADDYYWGMSEQITGDGQPRMSEDALNRAVKKAYAEIDETASDMGSVGFALATRGLARLRRNHFEAVNAFEAERREASIKQGGWYPSSTQK